MTDAYTITCCSTADMPASYMEEHAIPYACFHFHLNGKEYADDLGASIPFEEFYRQIDEGAMPTTAQINPEEYEALFLPILKEGKDICHLTLSSGISGSINSARIAAANLMEEYPERKIIVIDSLCASVGYGLLVDTALTLQKEGMDLDTLADWLIKNGTKLHHWFTTSDLTHLRRGGRVSASAAFFGNMLGICPIMQVSRTGTLIPQDKCRGSKKALRGPLCPGRPRLQGEMLHRPLRQAPGGPVPGRPHRGGLSPVSGKNPHYKHWNRHRLPHRSWNRGGSVLGRREGGVKPPYIFSSRSGGAYFCPYAALSRPDIQYRARNPSTAAAALKIRSAPPGIPGKSSGREPNIKPRIIR